ncbi:hypothetical protein EDB84DRAFT_1478455 [Lactarius hengduanensis]|nr:hypothetical protein EDB84DRAFT_1478455 [Lactarius hengduanensis]
MPAKMPLLISSSALRTSSSASSLILRVDHLRDCDEGDEAEPNENLKKLVGMKEMEDALKQLDELTQEEARMAAAQILNLTHVVNNKVTTVINDGKRTQEVVQQLANSFRLGSQVRESLRRWATPPGPSTIHNVACGMHRTMRHGRTAQWFFRGRIFGEWKFTG